MKVILVTGGAKRLGRAIIEEFAKHNYGCLIHANSSVEEAGILCDRIRSAGGSANVFIHEISDPALAANAMLDASMDYFSVLPTASVLSAASYADDERGGNLECTVASQMGLNFFFPAAYCAALAGRIKSLNERTRVDRSVTVFTDFKVHRVNPDFFSYSLSKHALEGAIPYLAVAFARQIRVNGIAPGPVLAANGLTQDELDAIVLSQTISGETPKIGDIAKTALFLTQTSAIIGQHIYVDAGARFDSTAREIQV